MSDRLRAAALAALCISLAAPLYAALRGVNTPIGTAMVLQQGVSIPVQGTAGPGESVTITFKGQTWTVAVLR